MKKASIIFILLFFASTVNAADWNLSTSVYKTIPTDSEAIIQSGSGLQISLSKGSRYLYISKDTNQVRFSGLGGPDIKFLSAGIGIRYKLGWHITISTDVGWYEPRFREMGEPQNYYSSPFAEGLCRYLNNFLMPDNQGQPWIPDWEYYSLTYHGSIGGKLNLVFEYPITERFSFNMNTGYRYLKLLENIKGEDYDGGYSRLGEAGYWSIRQDRDFSAYYVGAVIVYSF